MIVSHAHDRMIPHVSTHAPRGIPIRPTPCSSPEPRRRVHKDFSDSVGASWGLISSQAKIHRKKVDTRFIQAAMPLSDDLQDSATSKSLYEIPVSVQVILHIQTYIQTFRSAKACQKMQRTADLRGLGVRTHARARRHSTVHSLAYRLRLVQK